VGVNDDNVVLLDGQVLGEGAALTSVKVEIQQRLKRKLPALVNVMWE